VVLKVWLFFFTFLSTKILNLFHPQKKKMKIFGYNVKILLTKRQPEATLCLIWSEVGSSNNNNRLNKEAIWL
jgi:hypothetical protein